MPEGVSVAWSNEKTVGNWNSKEKITVTLVSQNQGANTSTVDIKGELYNGGTGTAVNGTGTPWSLSGAVTKGSANFTFSISGKKWGTVGTHRATISHDSSGNKRATISLYVGNTGTTTFGTPATVSVTFDLPRIIQKPSAAGTPTVSSISASTASAKTSAPSNNGGGSITGYEFQISKASNFSSPSTYASSGTTYNFTSLSANTDYWVRARAKNSAGWGDWSGGKKFTTKANAPAKVTGFGRVRVSDTAQDLSWTRNATGAAPYDEIQIERRDTINSTRVLIATLAGTATSYRDSTTVKGRRYDYYVQTKNGGGVSDWTAGLGVNTTPVDAGNVDAVKSGSTIDVTWDWDSTQWGLVNFVIQDNPAGSGWVTVATVGNVREWSYASPDQTKTHQFRVQPVVYLYDAGNPDRLYGAWSKASGVVQLLTAPLAPTLLSPVGGTLDRLSGFTFSWKHNPVDTTKQTAYELRYRLDGGAWVNLSGTTATTRAVAALNATATVEWQVRTKGDYVSFGNWSPVAVFGTGAPPSVTINEPVAGSYGSSRVTVEWGYYHTDTEPQSSWTAVLSEALTGVTVQSYSGSGGTTSRAFSAVLNDSTAYIVTVTATAANGLSATSTLEFVTDFPLPVTVEPQPVWDVVDGSATLTLSDPPVPEQFSWTGTPDGSTSERVKEGVTLTNLATNPSFEKSASSYEVMRNYHSNPDGQGTLTSGFNFWAGHANTGTASYGDPDGFLLGGSRRYTYGTVGAQSSGDVQLLVNRAVLNLGAGATFTAVWRMRASRDGFYFGAPNIYPATWGTVTAQSPALYVVAGEIYTFYATVKLNEDITGIPSDFRVLSGTGNKIVGDYFEVGDADIYAGELQPDRLPFTSTLSLDPDLVPSAVGSGASTYFTLKGVLPSGANNLPAAFGAQSEVWAAEGGKSLRVIPVETATQKNNSATRAYEFLAGDAGKTITIAAWCHIEEPLTGALHGNSRCILVDANGGGTYWSFKSTPAPNEAGTHLVRLTGTLNAGITRAPVFLYSGASAGNGDVWWDMLTIVEGNHPDLMPFTGSTQSTVDVETIDLQRQIDGGDWVTLAEGLGLTDAVKDPLPLSNGITRYRAVSRTSLPTEQIGEVIEFDPAEKRWIYFNYGAGWGEVARIMGNPAIQQATKRNREIHPMAGLDFPTSVRGSQLTAQYSASGVITPDSAQRSEWEELSWADTAICYRDPAGRRVFAEIDDMDVSGTTVESMSTTFERIHYVEGLLDEES